MKSGTELIAEERLRQIDTEGWAPEHDDDHASGELARAAAAYALPAGDPDRDSDDLAPRMWPWDMSWWKPGDGTATGRVRELSKAGALIAAEIDRIQRLDVKRPVES